MSEKHTFHIGTRVVGLGVMDNVNLRGMHGTVVGYSSTTRRDERLIQVKFDVTNTFFHTCGNKTPDKHGYNVFTELLAFTDGTVPVDNWE